MKLRYKIREDLVGRLPESEFVPARAIAGSAAYDLKWVPDWMGDKLDTQDEASIKLYPGEQVILGTGIHVDLPKNTAALVCSRSGLASKGIQVTNAPGIIDPGYQGEIKVILRNVNQIKWHYYDGTYYPETGSDVDFELISPLDRIAQLMIINFEPVEFENDPDFDAKVTARGSGGFGSSGR